MIINQAIFYVEKIHASKYYPANANSVTIEIEVEGNTISQTLYFGDGVKQASDAAELFYALGGTIDCVVGSPEHEAENSE